MVMVANSTDYRIGVYGHYYYTLRARSSAFAKPSIYKVTLLLCYVDIDEIDRQAKEQHRRTHEHNFKIQQGMMI